MPEGTPTAGDVRIEVKLQFGSFRGEYDQLWVEKEALQDFVSDFLLLAEGEGTEASVASMSPDELQLKILAKSTGQLNVSAHLKRFQYSGAVYWPTSISGGFCLSKDCLPTVATCLQSLVSSLAE